MARKNTALTPSFTMTIPKKTTTPILESHELPCKRIRGITVVIPPGHKGLAELQIFIASRQLVPSSGSGDSYVRGDDQEISYSPDVDVPGPPYMIHFRGKNEDLFLEHSFTIRVTVE